MDKNNQDLNFDRHPNPVSGLGGWLILVQIGLYGTLILLSNQLFSEILPFLRSEQWEVLTSKQSEYYHPLWWPTIIFETVYSALYIIFIVFILVNLYSKRKAFVLLMIVFYSSSLLFSIIDIVFLYQIPILREVEDGSSLKGTIRLAISCLIWIPYLLKSKRVKNTFVR